MKIEIIELRNRYNNKEVKIFGNTADEAHKNARIFISNILGDNWRVLGNVQRIDNEYFVIVEYQIKEMKD